jgi:hypothetical protein
MNKEFSKLIKYETPKISWSHFINQKPFPIFSDEVLSFFDFISKSIFKIKYIRNFPDLASYGFFCRKSNLENIKKKYLENLTDRSGRGMSLHFTPTNVPLNFAYSLLFGLISGNTCLIRIGSNHFDETRLFINLLNRVLKKKIFSNFKKKIIILNYKKNKNITNYLSKICDLRLIWGSDKSINEIRESPINPHAYDITFPDRISICIVNSNNYLKSKKFKRDAENFFNDSYLFDQNACTSPRLIYWFGEKKVNTIARDIFWKNFEQIHKKRNNSHNNNVFTIEKLTSEMSSIIDLDGSLSSENEKYYNTRIIIKNLPNNLENYISSGGFFLEYCNKKISPLQKILTDKIQTISAIGFEPKEIQKKLKLQNQKGVFRIVPNGRATEMGFVWDGFDLPIQMSKKIIFN